MVREEARLSFDQAKDDIKFARMNLSEGAFYESKREVPRKTHDLITLGKDIGVPENLMSFLREINPDYITTRYPDAANGLPSEIFDEKIAADHLDKAEAVIEWAASRMRTSDNS